MAVEGLADLFFLFEVFAVSGLGEIIYPPPMIPLASSKLTFSFTTLATCAMVDGPAPILLQLNYSWLADVAKVFVELVY